MLHLRRALRTILNCAFVAGAASAAWSALALASGPANPDWGVPILFALYGMAAGAAAGALFLFLRWVYAR